MSWKGKFPKQNIYFQEEGGILYQGNAIDILKTLPDESVDCIITSPPYWQLRSYLPDNHPDKSKEIGLEPTLDLYLDHMLQITTELKRVLKKTGVCFWNHGDNYGGAISAPNAPKLGKRAKNRICQRPAIGKPKCMCMQNYRLILRMLDEQGWILRDIIIWAKKVWIEKEDKTIGNAMPSSVRDRCAFTYEPIFMLVKNKRYFFDQDILRIPYKEPLNRCDRNMRPNLMGANRPNVWQVNTEPFLGAHYSVYPQKLIKPLVLAGYPQWICKQCGKARVRLVKSNLLNRNENVVPSSVSSVRVSRAGNSIHQTIGWTNCSCPDDGDKWQSGIVLDPFMGSGTTAVVAKKLGRNWIGIELNPKYCKIAKNRIKKVQYQPQLL